MWEGMVSCAKEGGQLEGFELGERLAVLEVDVKGYGGVGEDFLEGAAHELRGPG